MTKIIVTIAALFTFTAMTVAQTNTFPATGAAGIGTTSPNSSSLLDVSSTAKGVLLPRMTQLQRNGIDKPATGLLIYQTNNTPGFYYYTGSAWTAISLKGANTALSNLAATKINASLLPATDNTIDLGSSALRWGNIYVANLLLSNDANIHGMTVGLGGGAQGANTAVGGAALPSNTTGFENTAIGTYTLQFNGTGNSNTAIGYRALVTNATGGNNTATGGYSLSGNTGGSANAAFGYGALSANATGTNNTALGTAANVISDALTNATAVGFAAIVDASNKVRIGNADVTSIGGQVGWTSFSDGRYKKDIKENVPGLAFINALRPITYTVNVQGINDYYKNGSKQTAAHGIAENNHADKQADKASATVYTGFVAQEVEKAAQQLNYNFSGVDKPQSKDGLYGLRYDNFVAPLVKAVQELSNQNKELKKAYEVKLNDLQSQVDQLKALVLAQSSVATLHQQGTNLSTATLLQNIPNPVKNATTISYAIPQQFTNAKLIITDNAGKTLKAVNITAAKGSVQVNLAALPAGTYQYTLYADNKLLDSKTMIVAK